jgi:hypothetical protein
MTLVARFISGDSSADCRLTKKSLRFVLATLCAFTETIFER